MADDPLSESYFAAFDVLAAGYIHLRICYALEEISTLQLLDATFPHWEDLLGDGFEIFTASDGERAFRVLDS